MALAVFAAAAIGIGTWVGARIEDDVTARTAGITALYVDSIVTPHLQTLSQHPSLDDQSVATLDHLVAQSSFGDRIVALKVWSLDGTILYSPARELIGQRFPVEGGLARAVRGEVSAEMSDLAELENLNLRAQWTKLLEIYVPARQDAGGALLAVAEFYELPDQLDAQIAQARLGSWGVVALTMLVSYALLAGIVRTGSDTIGRQQRSLRAQVAELRRLLDENERLRDRVSVAAQRTTTLNEQALRRISADLHDGPAQALAFALLRLDEAGTDGTLAAARKAIADALGEIRAISAGLRLPDLERATVREIVARTIDDHTHRSGTAVTLDCRDLPASAPLAIKTALVRTMQEALSNATRHGQGANVSVGVHAAGGMLRLTVRDEGPGFDASRRSEGLGLAGMRERAELLGGDFAIVSQPGRGTEVRAAWPLAEIPA